MAIGIIGTSPAPAPGKVIVDSNFYDSGFSNIPFELEPGAYRVTAEEGYTLDSTTYSPSTSIISVSGTSQASFGDREFKKISNGIVAYNESINFTITFIFPALDGDGKFLWATDGNRVAIMDDTDPTGRDGEWQPYTTMVGQSWVGVKKSPHETRYLGFGGGGYLYYFNSDQKSLSYYTQNNTSNGQTQTQRVNGVVFGATSWIAYQDDCRVIVSNNTDTSSAGFGYDLGLGSSDFDSGGYINGTYVVVLADGTYFTAAEGSLNSWTNRGSLSSWIRQSGGNYNSIFTYNNKLWAASNTSSTTPFYSSTDGITWAPDSGISVPFATGVYGIENVAGSSTFWEVRTNSSANGGVYITEDFVNYTNGLGPTSNYSTNRRTSLSIAGDIHYVNSGIFKVLTGNRNWAFEFLGPTTSAN